MPDSNLIHGYRPPRSRLLPPDDPTEYLDRPDLVAAVCASFESRRLTLLSAPAGYGKTTLLAAAAHNRARSAWLTVDEDDDDPSRFLHAVIAAVRELDPNCGTTALAVLAATPTASPSIALDRLIDDILGASRGPFVLVLDEVESLGSPAVYGLLDDLLDHLPATMTVAIGSRRDPPLSLARLRARDQLSEFRVADLRFSEREAQAFLAGRGVLLPDTDLGALHERTEGWPAGYQLLAAALERTPGDERGRYLEAVTRSDRFAGDFLVDDVLQRQPPDVQQFLLRTSVLSDMTVGACNVLTDRTDAGAVLELLVARDLFVTRRAPGSYRYHALFRQSLERELTERTPDIAADMHARAASHVAATQPDQAITHLAKAGDLSGAADLIERAGEALILEGFTEAFNRWMSLLPTGLVESRPRLEFLVAAATFESGDLQRAQPMLTRVLPRLVEVGDGEGHGRALAMLAVVAVQQDDVQRAGPLIEEALAAPVPAHDRVTLLIGRARLALLGQRWVEAQRDLEEALQLAQDTEGTAALYAITFLNPTFAFLPRGLSLLERAADLVRLRMGDPLPPGPMRITHDGQMAFVHLLRGRLDDAINASADGMDLIVRLGSDAGASALMLSVTAVSVHVALGNDEAVEALLGMLMFGAAQAGMGDAQIPGAFFLLGKLRWSQGRVEEAHQLYDRMAASVEEGKLPGAPVLRAMLGGLLEMSAHQFDKAEATLRRAVVLEDERRLSLAFGSARPLLAHLYLASDRPTQAADTIEPFLDECESRGTPGLALREGRLMVPLLRLALDRRIHPGLCRRLLTALGESAPASPIDVPGTGERLTRREIEVLRLIAEGASNGTIAERLVISLHTVKRHVGNLLTKLGATSRTEAAAKARDLRIV